ncbi:MAG: DUF3015 family protein [Bdellovibrio sp.]|jgi:hypothetical protein
MKLVFAIIMLIGASAMAQDKLDGCGLGWQVTDKRTYTATSTRGTTNFLVPPAFGMTTGTLGCDKLDVGSNDKEAADYVATNFEVLKSELANGRGEYVSALAKTMNCSSAAFGSHIQQNYEKVVAPAATAADLYKGIKAETKELCI